MCVKVSRVAALPRVGRALLAAVLLLVVGCADVGKAEDARLLDRYASLDLLAVPGATEVGRARVLGGNPGLTGGPSALVAVLASPLPFEEQLQAFEQRFRERYALSPYGIRSTTSAQLLGRLPDPPGTVTVTATSEQPVLPGGGQIAPAPAGTRSWLTLRLQVP